MNTLSRAHHFLPVFYLKGFANQRGEFFIYLVKGKRFKKEGIPFTPDSHFFEIDGNTVTKEEEKSDVVEQGYSQLDNKASTLFNKIITRKMVGMG